MTQTHTPGPWSLIHFGGPQIGHEPSGEAVCTMWGDEDDPSDPIHANARLIAAAPELLGVAKDAHEWLSNDGCIGGCAIDEFEIIHRLADAIAKATGK